MKTKINQSDHEARTIQSKTKAANQAPVEEIMQRYATQRKAANRTGLPDDLKGGVEQLSGQSMDDVRVHYNSDKPSQLQALAYTQGTDIHVAPGQEQHLPHEAWHVVQQKQGRVKATTQLAGVGINDDLELEHEADTEGEKAVQRKEIVQFGGGKGKKQKGGKGQKQKAEKKKTKEESENEKIADDFDAQWEDLNANPGSIKGYEAVEIDGVRVMRGAYSKWSIGGKIYHLNLRSVTYHVSEENGKRQKYFFKRDGLKIVPCTPTKEEKGKSSKMFDRLPEAVQEFVSDHYSELLP